MNLSALGLSGHSRGGEAITVAHLLDKLKHNATDPAHNFSFGISALYAIAPVDAQNDVAAIRPITLRKADYYIMQGTHDGDVSTFEGQQMFDRALPVTEAAERYKGLLWVYGAYDGVLPLESAGLQRVQGLLYRRSDVQFPSRRPPCDSVSGPEADVFLDHYQEDGDVATGSAAGVANSPNSLSVYRQTAFSDHGPDYWLWQQTNGLIAGWEKTKAGEVVVKIPSAVAAQADSYTHLAFRVAQTFEQPARLNAPGVSKDFSVQLTFGNANSAPVLVSSKATLPYPEDTGDLTKTILQTVRIPWQDFTPKGGKQNLSALTEIHLKFDRHDGGILAMDEIQFTR